MTDQGASGLGSAADEAAKLFAAAQDWIRVRTGPVTDGPMWSGSLWDREHLATGAAECTVCPLCQTVATLRQITPETVEHLLDAAASLVAAMRTAVSSPSRPDERHPGVQHIDIREG